MPNLSAILTVRQPLARSSVMVLSRLCDSRAIHFKAAAMSRMKHLYALQGRLARALLTILFKGYIVSNMTRDTDDLQRADEEAKLARCVELYHKAERSTAFSSRDLDDLGYFLGVNDYLKEKA